MGIDTANQLIMTPSMCFLLGTDLTLTLMIFCLCSAMLGVCGTCDLVSDVQTSGSYSLHKVSRYAEIFCDM